MKRIFFISVLFFAVSANLFAQFKISGFVYDSEKYPVHSVFVSYYDGNIEKTTQTNQDGGFYFNNVPAGQYNLWTQCFGFEPETLKVTVDKDVKIDFYLQNDELTSLEKVVVTNLRASDKTPVAYTTIQSADIEKNNLAQDIPYLLKNSPSIVISSDAGNGLGYTQMRIRGTDLTRINVTLNGIPLNDPESHGVWWVDVPDFATSVDNIQIQRGVGTSTNGAGAFGATVNLKTDKIEKDANAEISSTYGSFNTFKHSLKYNTGIINEHFSFVGRLSKLSSDGYVDRAYSDMKSFFVSGAYFKKNTLLKFNIFSGVEDTYQAWNGVPKVRLESDEAGMFRYLDHGLYSEEEYIQMVSSEPRTYNFYTFENEIDHYEQTHYQLQFVQKIGSNLKLDLSGFLIRGLGYYEQYKNDQEYSDYGMENVVVRVDTIYETDMIRQKWLDNYYYGANYNFLFDRKQLEIVLGGGYNNYDGMHYGYINWMQYAGNYQTKYKWYENNGIKSEFNNYLKINYDLAYKLNIYGDLQYRIVDYSIKGVDDDLAGIDQKHSYDFFNPKFGVLFHPNLNTAFYASYAIAQREPSRQTFIDAPQDKEPKPETLYDYEIGYRLSSSKFSFIANLYYMDYIDQLVMTGEINDVGDAIFTNVEKSYRRGVELSAGYKLFSFVDWSANVALSQNKILNFTEYVDNWDYWNDPENSEYQIVTDLGTTDLSFSPSIVANNVFIFSFLKYFNADFSSQYVGRQYIDNTAAIENSLDPYFVNDISLGFNIRTKLIQNIKIACKINNLFNEKYETYAWVYSYYYENQKHTMDGYFPQAGRNFLMNISLKF